MATAASLSDELSPAVVMPRNPTAVVNRGDSLWRISRITYGDGARYAVVYKANRELIRNPNRIYPGQIFVLPIKTP
jgi:nucleoid-associated protein YgaU